MASVLDRVVIRDGLAAGLLDLSNDLVGRLGRLPLAGGRSAQVIDDDLGTAGCQKECVASAQALRRAGYDGDTPVKLQFLAHGPSFQKQSELTV